MSQTEQLLKWIGEESSERNNVSIHLLLVKQALAARGEGADLTASTKLSLELYERSATYRGLRELYTQGLLEFIGENGESVIPTEQEISKAGTGEKVSFQTVRLTAAGREKLHI